MFLVGLTGLNLRPLDPQASKACSYAFVGMFAPVVPQHHSAFTHVSEQERIPTDIRVGLGTCLGTPFAHSEHTAGMSQRGITGGRKERRFLWRMLTATPPTGATSLSDQRGFLDCERFNPRCVCRVSSPACFRPDRSQ
jgi:hypothetical protein